MSKKDRIRGALVGLACGDAVGTTAEFQPRGTFEQVTDMVGGGVFNLEAGQWTDDTAMALCLGQSLMDCGKFDAQDQMTKYVKWWKEGYMSSTNECFDIGDSTRAALSLFNSGVGVVYAGSTSEWSAGNGSLMRLSPIPIFYCDEDHTDVMKYAELSSKTTHANEECLDACRYYALLIQAAIHGNSKESLLTPEEWYIPSTSKIKVIADGRYKTKTVDEISGSGYVVDALEAALWCFYNTDSFEDAVLWAANLGDDADTTAAIVGQLAGAYYGMSGIPESWINKLAMADGIVSLADALGEAKPEIE